MHHILRGTLGAALVYPLVWYYSSHADPVQPAVTKLPSSRVEERQSPHVDVVEEPVEAPVQWSPPQAPAVREVAQPAREAAPEPAELRAVRQRVAEVAPQVTPPSEPERPRSPSPEEPKVPFPAFAELRDAFGQMKDLQAVAHDPKALDERVQVTEYDAQKVAKLRALAEQFVDLPVPPGERYLPAGKPSRSTSSR